MNAGTGVFNQTAGSVGKFAGTTPVQAIGLMVGGNWASQNAFPHSTSTTYVAASYSSSGNYTLGDGSSSPLLVGGLECVGVTGTGTFTQNSGTNALVGGGDFGGSSTTTNVPYSSKFGGRARLV